MSNTPTLACPATELRIARPSMHHQTPHSQHLCTRAAGPHTLTYLVSSGVWFVQLRGGGAGNSLILLTTPTGIVLCLSQRRCILLILVITVGCARHERHSNGAVMNGMSAPVAAPEHTQRTGTSATNPPGPTVPTPADVHVSSNASPKSSSSSSSSSSAIATRCGTQARQQGLSQLSLRWALYRHNPSIILQHRPCIGCHQLNSGIQTAS